MILRGLHVDGYGVWNDFSVRTLAPGLNVFVGRNEAGKSTLHAFVRQMLYGFPDGRSKESAHAPLRGGEHGGRLLLDAEGGAITLQRSGRAKKLPELIAEDGTRLPPSLLDGWLRGTDPTLYRNVFAFGIEELASLDSLSQEEIGARIFDAGLEGAGRSVSAWMAELRKRKEFEHRARGGRLRELAAEIAGIERSLNEARSRAAGHGKLLAAETEAVARLREIEGEASLLREQAFRLRALLGVWPAELRRREAVAILAGAADERAVPREVLRAFDDRSEEIDRLQRECEERRIESEGWASARDALLVDERIPGAAAAITRVAGEAELHGDRRVRLESLRVVREEKQRTVEARLEEMGSGWTEPRVLALERSVARRERILLAEERLTSAAVREREAGAEVTRVDAEIARAERERAAIELGEEPLAVHAIDARRGALAELRAASAEREAARHRAEAAGRAPGRAVLALPWGIGGLFLVGAVFAWILGAPGAAVVSFAAALACGAIGFAIGRDRGGSERAAAAAASGEAEARGRKAAEALGLTDDAGPGAIERVAARIEREAEARRGWDDRSRQAQGWERRILALHAEREAALAALAAAGEARRDLEAGWAAEIADLGVEVRPAGARELLERAERVAAAAEALRGAEREIAGLEAACGAWDAALAELVAEAGVPRGTTIAQLVERLERSVEAARLRAELESKLAGHAERIDSLAVQIDRLRARRAGILVDAAVEDRASLEARIERGERLHAARRMLEEAERSIAEGLGEGAAAESLRERLVAGDRLEWEEAASETERRLADAESERLRLHEALVLRRREREELEGSADVPQLAAQLEASRAAFSASLGRWRAAALLERLLQETLDRFQRERQPAVIRYAGEAFAQVTKGRYPSLRQPAGVAAIEAVDGDGRPVPSAALSRGTRDQLYLCLRLGLVRAFAERGTKLPLLMDDVLVNFDPERAAAMAEVLARFAEEHQVLFFTCHPETVVRLRAAAPDVPVVELGR